ncbi:hypothetical protein, partial [Arthrobacter sp. SDTb3-6]|uniref:hypothetical protein n=1 Tax=Arthrobacter sp. SDTb3-6 TaxID=2713571 RepID=UPI001C3FFD45
MKQSKTNVKTQKEKFSIMRARAGRFKWICVAVVGPKRAKTDAFNQQLQHRWGGAGAGSGLQGVRDLVHDGVVGEGGGVAGFAAL